MSLSRRSFLTRLLPAVGGAIVAPTLAETLAVSDKKYFFLRNNPFALKLTDSVELTKTFFRPGKFSALMGFPDGCVVSRINGIITDTSPLPIGLKHLIHSQNYNGERFLEGAIFDERRETIPCHRGMPVMDKNFRSLDIGEPVESVSVAEKQYLAAAQRDREFIINMSNESRNSFRIASGRQLEVILKG